LNRGGLGSKSLCGNRFYKRHRDIAEKASQNFKKASIAIKMYVTSCDLVPDFSIFQAILMDFSCVV
jgi:hypothetical protein